MRWQELFTSEILLVSGKGGTGKSTVAAAMATTAASTGRTVLLSEVEGRGEVSRMLGVPDPGFVERAGPAGFNVLSITPQAAAHEYLRLFFGLDRVSRSLLRTGVLDQLIGAAPGFRDLLACGKLYEITTVRRTDSRDRGRALYDLVIVDAPPTGQIVSFLEAPAAFAELIRVGRMRRQAAAIRDLLRGRARVVLVSTLEEMAVAETLEAVAAVAEAGIRVAAIVANRRAPEVFPPGTRRAAARLDPATMSRLAGEAGVELDADLAGSLVVAASTGEGRFRLQSSFSSRLEVAGIPLLTLPEVPATEPPDLVAALASEMGGPKPANGLGRTTPPPRSRPATGDAESARPVTLDRLLAGPRIVVVCGSGGVGKTTVSAAVALHLAESGRRTILLTVDPARRLATALGLPFLAGERTELRLARGQRLEALQLDTQRTFDELIRRYAASAERRDRILGNPFYRRISDTLSGTSEYMAMEKLYELAAEENHEALIIDTPPTRSALSFLDAPNRLTDFLGGRFLRWMVWPSAWAGRLTLGAARRGATAFARTAGRLVGVEAIADAAEFLSAFEGMYGGFKERAARVLELLRSPECAFLVVTAPRGPSLEEAGFFVERLRQNGMRPAAVVVNRWHRSPPLPSLDEARKASEALAAGSAEQRALAAILADGVRREPERVAERAAMAGFAGLHPDIPIVPVPELAEDVHDLRGLRRMAAALFDDRIGESSSRKPSRARPRLLLEPRQEDLDATQGFEAK